MSSSTWKLVLIIVGTLVVATLTTAFDNALESLGFLGRVAQEQPWLYFAGVFLMTLAIMWLVIRVITRLANPMASFSPERLTEGEGRQVLIVPLSSFTNFKFDRAAATKAIEDLCAAGLDAASRPVAEIEKGSSLAAAMEHPWVQGFRAMRPHGKSLKRLYIIPSISGGGASAPDAWRFAVAARRMLSDNDLQVFIVDAVSSPVPVTTAVDGPEPGRESELRTTGVDYGDYNALQRAFLEAIRDARRAGFARKSICIDVTSGTKQVSIAGAVAALNIDALLSYVDNPGNCHTHFANIDPGVFADELI